MPNGDTLTALQQRVARLETEVQQLKRQVGSLRHEEVLAEGVAATVTSGDGQLVRLVVGLDGWGSGRPEDVAAVCVSCVETIFQAFSPRGGEDRAILVIAGERTRMLYQPGPNGEHVVLLRARDHRWAQYAYQFSHELGHVLCGGRENTIAQEWIDEAFCEALSIWALERMAKTWRHSPPYANWAEYAPYLAEYALDVRREVGEPLDLPRWYAENRWHLAHEQYDRGKNLVVARRLADHATANPDFFRAFCHLRESACPSDASLEQLLGTWLASCPAHLQFAPLTVARLLGVTPVLPRQH